MDKKVTKHIKKAFTIAEITEKCFFVLTRLQIHSEIYNAHYYNN